MQIRTYVYFSTAVQPLELSRLEHLLSDARQYNSAHDITGVLLHSDRHFMQCLEGSAEALEVVLKRIKASKLHRGMLELLNSTVFERRFLGWSMGFTRSNDSELLHISNAQWSLTQNDGRPSSPAFILLDAFWRAHQPADIADVHVAEGRPDFHGR